MRIVSVPGRTVRDPVTRRVLDADGLEVQATDLYWARLLADGDVQEAPKVEDPAPAEPPAPATDAEPAASEVPAPAEPAEPAPAADAAPVPAAAAEEPEA